MAGKITTVQQRLIDLLYADPFFTDLTIPLTPVVKVPIIFKKQGDIESQLDEQLANLNVGLVVILRHAHLVEEGVLSLDLDCQFALSAVTDPLIKDAGTPEAYDIVEKAAVILQGQFNGATVGDQSESSRFMADKNAIGPLPASKEKAHLDIQLLLVNTTISLK
jgi:hypothetical protein